MVLINSSLLPAASVLMALSLALGSCAVTPHPLTHSNERQDGTTMTYYNQQLNTRLQLYGDYDVELHPRNQVDRVTKQYLRALGLRRKQIALLFTSHTYAAPTYSLRTLLVSKSLDWQAKGFQKTERGGFIRASTAGTELRLEYAVALEQQPGWLYLLASAPAPTPRQVQQDQLDPSLSTRRRAMAEEFTQFIFPSIASGQPRPASK